MKKSTSYSGTTLALVVGLALLISAMILTLIMEFTSSPQSSVADSYRNGAPTFAPSRNGTSTHSPSFLPTTTPVPTVEVEKPPAGREDSVLPTSAPSDSPGVAVSGSDEIDVDAIEGLDAPSFSADLFRTGTLPVSLDLPRSDVETLQTKLEIRGELKSNQGRIDLLAKVFHSARHVLGRKSVTSGGSPRIEYDSENVSIRLRMLLPKDNFLRNAFFQRVRSSLLENCGCGQSGEGLGSVELVKVTAGSYTWERLKRPNIMMFMTDDQGWADVGWRFEGPMSPTPKLDAFRKVSTELMQMYSAPLCSPSRAMLFTGRLAHHTGYGPAVTEGIMNHLSGNETLLAEILKANGYYNAMFGKWHLGITEKRNRPENRGFDAVFGEGSIKYTSRWNTLTFNDKSISVKLQGKFGMASGVSLFNGTDIAQNVSYAGSRIPLYTSDEEGDVEEKHQVDLLEEEVLRFLDTYTESAKNTKPLFAFIGSRMPHTPLIPPKRYKYSQKLRNLFIASKDRTAYLQMVHAADAVLGEILAKLEATGIWKDTVFIFLTDNGGLSTRKGGASNKPLQGRKNLLWEGGIRVISLVSGTTSALAPLSKNARGGENYDLMHFVDWLPTLCSGVAGISDYSNAWKCETCTAHQDNKLDGSDLWKSIQAGGVDPIQSSERVLPLQVIPLLQSQVASGEVNVLNVLPRSSYDVAVYKGSRFEHTINFEKSKLRLTAHRRRFVKHGGGAMRMGRYKLLFASNYHCVPDYPWECQAFEDRSTVNALAGSLDKWLQRFVPGYLVDGKLPGHQASRGYLFDIWEDPGERINLLRGSLSSKATEALKAMLQRYSAEQVDGVLDGKITHGFTVDPAVTWFVNKEGAWSGGCEYSIHCNYE